MWIRLGSVMGSTAPHARRVLSEMWYGIFQGSRIANSVLDDTSPSYSTGAPAVLHAIGGGIGKILTRSVYRHPSAAGQYSSSAEPLAT
jgi:hypothetical protein